MKKNIVTMVLAVLGLVSVALSATYSGGTGTVGDPYIISSATDMVTLSQTPADWGSSFSVSGNISLTGQTLNAIGTFATPFSGTFNGGSNTISNYTNTAVLNSDYVAGLFGYNTGTVSNLTVSGTIAPAEQFPALGSGWIGGIVGVNDGTVSNCVFGAAGTITVESSGSDIYNVAVGGIVGDNSGTVSNCLFLGSISGAVYNVYVGGIAGVNFGTLTSCDFGGSADIILGFIDNSGVANPNTMAGGVAGYNVGTITDSGTSPLTLVQSSVDVTYLGGLVGMNAGLITGSESAANVVATATSGNIFVGGFCGLNQAGTISECAALGDVTSGRYGTAGGFAAWNNDSGIIEISYFAGDVTTSLYNYVGEFVGTNSGAIIRNCYAIGNVNLPVNITNSYYGGLVGSNDNGATVLNSYVVDKTAKGSLSNSQALIAGAVAYRPVDTGAITMTIWNQTTSGLTTGVGSGATTGVVGKTTANMKLQSEFTGWDFSTIWAMSDSASAFEGYPIFQWQVTGLDTLTINLNTNGWTWISFNVLPAGASIADVFANYSGTNNDLIVSSSGANATYINGSWFGGLQTIEAGKMYKIKSALGGSFVVTGSYVDPATPINLVVGSNWLGYTLPSATSLTSALANMTKTNGDVITSQTGQNATYFNGTWYGGLTQLEPGKGYMLNVNQAQVFAYTGLAPGFIPVVTMEVTTQESPEWESPEGLANNMTIYPQVTDTATSQLLGQSASSMISAWTPGGEIAGVTNAYDMGGGVFFFPLTVFSDSAVVNGMTLQLYDGVSDTVYIINETFDFAANDVQGSPFDPIPFTANAVSTQTYTVTFVAGDHGTITAGDAVQEVAENGSAEAPTITANTGWTFTGWDVAFNNVTSDLTVTAQYTVQTFTVTFSAGAHGTITGGTAVQTVNYGGAAVAPTITPVAGWNFTGWDVAFNNVTSNLTVTAQYAVQTFTVTFNAGTHGTITGGTAVQTVNYGTSAVAPTITPAAGWNFTGWDVAFNNVTSNLTVTAQYAVQTFTVTFNAGAHGTITGGTAVQTVNYGGAAVEPTITAESGWDFTGWDVAFTNVTSNLTVTATYQVHVPDMYTVVFSGGTHGALNGDTTQIVESGNSAVAPVVEPDTYWEFTGWNMAFDNVTSNLNVSALYSPITCAAADFNVDGTVYVEDLEMLAMDWLGEGALAADINGNGYINLYDYLMVSDCWMYTAFITQTFNIHTGWNWVSFNVLPEDASVANVMADYANIGFITDIIQASSGASVTYISGTWVGSLQTIQAGKMYKIKHSGTGGSFGVNGLAADVNTPINLVKGTNWLGYIPQEPRSIGVALASLDATNGDVITASNGQNATYYFGTWYGALQTLEPGKGYTLKVDKAQTFVYGDVLNPMDMPLPMSIQAVPVTWVSPVGLANSMTVNAQVMQGLSYVGTAAGSKVSVWNSDGSIAGVADVMSGPAGQQFVITVFSDNAVDNGMTLKLYDAATDMVYDIQETLDFVSAAVVATIITPQIYTIPESWTSPVGLANSMSCYIQIYSNGVQIGTATGSMLSAWNPDGSIAGVASTVAGPFGPFFPLTVFSDDAAVAGMKLKLYDAATGTYYDVNGSFDFVADGSLGTFMVPAIFYVGNTVGWYEQDTNLPPSNWTINGSDLASGPTAAMTGSGVSSAAMDISTNTNATFSVQTDCGNGCFLIFGITDAVTGVYTIVDYWSGLTPVTPVTVDLTPYKASGNNVIFRWTYSKGRFTAGQDKVWVWNFQLN